MLSGYENFPTSILVSTTVYFPHCKGAHFSFLLNKIRHFKTSNSRVIIRNNVSMGSSHLICIHWGPLLGSGDTMMSKT